MSAGGKLSCGQFRRTLISQEEMVPEYCEYFRGKSFEELDQLARSFHFGTRLPVSVGLRSLTYRQLHSARQARRHVDQLQSEEQLGIASWPRGATSLSCIVVIWRCERPSIRTESHHLHTALLGIGSNVPTPSLDRQGSRDQNETRPYRTR